MAACTTTSEGRESKDFHVLDGQGMVLLRRFGIAVAFITARDSQSAAHRARDLGVQGFIGAKDKLAQVRALCEEQGIGLDEVAFMGDDLPDLEAMLAVGLSVAPANAHRLGRRPRPLDHHRQRRRGRRARTLRPAAGRPRAIPTCCWPGARNELAHGAGRWCCWPPPR